MSNISCEIVFSKPKLDFDIMQLAALMSIYRFKSGDNGQNEVSSVDEEQGSYIPPVNGENPIVFKSSNGHERRNRSTRQIAATLGYIHQILFQASLPGLSIKHVIFSA